MAPEQRTPREITYHVGWRKGKILSARDVQDKLQAGEQRNKTINSVHFAAALLRWTEFTLWKKAPLPSAKLMQAVVFILPAIVFGLFVWMVFWLSRFS